MSKIWTPEDIKEFENRFKVKCTLRPDGMYDVKGSINFYNFSITSLLDWIPPIHTLDGYLSCVRNCLEDLKGAPRIITKFLDCENNSLYTLDGAPESIGEYFDCKQNPDLRFDQSEIDAMNIQGYIDIAPDQLVIRDPKEFIKKGLLPI